MGLVPEFFVLLGIYVFLAMSLLSHFLDDDRPSLLQYLFQVAAAVGLGELLVSGRFVSLTGFWVSMVYLGFALSSVVGLNVYLGFRRRMNLASLFSGTVTLPILIISALFISSFLGSGGEASFSLSAILILAVPVLIAGLGIFVFLRELSGRIRKAPGGSVPSLAGPVSAPPWTPETGLTLHLPSLQGEEWEESTKKKESYD